MLHDYTKKYELLSDMFDEYDRLTPQAILSIYEDVAARNASLIGIGYDEVKSKKLIWAIVRVKIEIIDNPTYMGEVEVTTWPHKPNRFDFQRDFIIKEKDKIILKGTSLWVLVDLEKRNLVPSSVFEELAEYDDYYVLGKGLKLNKVNKDNLIASSSFKAYGSLIDHNHHMNNKKYIEKMMEVFEIDKDKKLKEFEVNFARETVKNSECDISIYQNNNEYVMEVTENSVTKCEAYLKLDE